MKSGCAHKNIRNKYTKFSNTNLDLGMDEKNEKLCSV